MMNNETWIWSITSNEPWRSKHFKVKLIWDNIKTNEKLRKKIYADLLQFETNNELNRVIEQLNKQWRCRCVECFFFVFVCITSNPCKCLQTNFEHKNKWKTTCLNFCYAFGLCFASVQVKLTRLKRLPLIKHNFCKNHTTNLPKRRKKRRKRRWQNQIPRLDPAICRKDCKSRKIRKV